MERTTRKSNGQAVIELTILVAAVLFVICATIAVVATIRKIMKHNFITTSSPATPSEDISTVIEDKLKTNVRFFEKQKTVEIIDRLKDEGWSEDRRLKVPQGLIVLLTNGERHMDFIKSKAGNLGVYH